MRKKPVEPAPPITRFNVAFGDGGVWLRIYMANGQTLSIPYPEKFIYGGYGVSWEKLRALLVIHGDKA